MHAKLRVRRGDQTMRLYIIRPGQRFSVGRTKGTSIIVSDPRVSRRHAEIEFRSDGLFFTDLESRNGTYVDDHPLKARHPQLLVDGSRVRLGRHIMQIELRSPNDDTRSQTNAHRQLDAPLLPANEFELLEEIGSGGVGRVWVARQKILGRKVAIKFLRAEIKADGEFERRFLREARLCCKLRSEKVVKVYDVRISRGRAYMIMELVNGPSALDVVSEGPIGLLDALSIGADVADALASAQALGIVHRDVKPANILLHPSGVAKLADFGIAKDLGASVNLTETGMGLGSLPYASPEQIMDAKSVDHRSDIYGLGATLYHLIGGEPPFRQGLGEGLAGMIHKVCEDEPPPLLDLRPDCPAQIATLVHSMLKKHRDQRPASVAKLAKQLRRLRARFFPRDPVDLEATDDPD